MRVYVHCNPITHFDPLGLKFTSTEIDHKYKFTFSASIVFREETEEADREKIVARIRGSIMETFNGGGGDWSLKDEDLDLKVSTSAANIRKDDHIFVITSDEEIVTSYAPGKAEPGGALAYLYKPYLLKGEKGPRTPAHELVHLLGLNDNVGNIEKYMKNVSEDVYAREWDEKWKDRRNLTSRMVQQIHKNYKTEGAINNDLGPRTSIDGEMYSKPRNPEALQEATIPFINRGYDKKYSDPYNYGVKNWDHLYKR